MIQAETLIQFCRKIGIEATVVKEAEALWECNLVRDVPARELKHISTTDLDALTKTFGDALSMRIGIPSGPPLLEISQGIVTTELAQALRHIAQRDDALELRFDLSLDKAAILRQYQLRRDKCHALFYLFKENLVRFLRSPLPRLDDTFFVADYLDNVIFRGRALAAHAGETCGSAFD